MLVQPAAAQGQFEADIRTDTHGIPHILAEDWGGLGFGYGYAFARDNICTIADSYVTVRAERSRYFGPDAGYPQRGNGFNVASNLNSDFFYQRIIDTGQDRGPAGPGASAGPAARGARGRPRLRRRLQPLPRRHRRRQPARPALPRRRVGEADHRDRRLPPLLPARPARLGDDRDRRDRLVPAARQRVGRRCRPTRTRSPTGSRTRSASCRSAPTASGSAPRRPTTARGWCSRNPHFPWDGPERFYQSHLTIPGEVNVSGGSLFGVPLVLIGHNDNLAWTHTVSTAYRFTPVPGDDQPR